MTKSGHKGQGQGAFSLVELMTAIAVLSVIMVMVSVLLTGATKATQMSKVRMDADRQARLIFDSMAEDFALMLRRPDVDFHFVKQAGNDCFFMFCESSGYFDSTQTSGTESNMSLVGYRINTISNPPTDFPYTMEKMAKGLAWDLQTAATPNTYPVPYLTYDNLPTDYTPDAASTIVGNWSNIDKATYADGNFHMLGDSTFRMEFCFLLTDGTYSLVPARSYPGGGAPSVTETVMVAGVPKTVTVANNLVAITAPSPSNGFSSSGTNYGVGSRWYDTKHQQGYVCTYAPPAPSNAAVWVPLGMSDVQAVVVAIAILDTTTQKMMSNRVTALSNMVSALKDPVGDTTDLNATPPVLMGTTWLNAVNSSSFASTAGVPNPVAAQVRIYQRFFYLNNVPNSL